MSNAASFSDRESKRKQQKTSKDDFDSCSGTIIA